MTFSDFSNRVVGKMGRTEKSVRRLIINFAAMALTIINRKISLSHGHDVPRSTTKGKLRSYWHSLAQQRSNQHLKAKWNKRGVICFQAMKEHFLLFPF